MFNPVSKAPQFGSRKGHLLFTNLFKGRIAEGKKEKHIFNQLVYSLTATKGLGQAEAKSREFQLGLPYGRMGTRTFSGRAAGSWTEAQQGSERMPGCRSSALSVA